MKYLVVVFILLVACAAQPQYGTPPEDAKQVIIKDGAYSLQTTRIKVGQSIIWYNTDSVIHTATADNGQFDSNEMLSGDKYWHTFWQQGKYPYHSTLNPDMKGEIIVE